VDYSITLFDDKHNNPARSGDPTVRPWLKRNARDLVLDLTPDCLLLLTSAVVTSPRYARGSVASAPRQTLTTNHYWIP
jgi:hypothetical protein